MLFKNPSKNLERKCNFWKNTGAGYFLFVVSMFKWLGGVHRRRYRQAGPFKVGVLGVTIVHVSLLVVHASLLIVRQYFVASPPVLVDSPPSLFCHIVSCDKNLSVDLKLQSN